MHDSGEFSRTIFLDIVLYYIFTADFMDPFVVSVLILRNYHINEDLMKVSDVVVVFSFV